MIVLDTTVLVYAVGDDHRLREPARRIVEAAERGAVQASTTIEVIQEFVHVRARRRTRADAASLGRAYAALLSPLLRPSEQDLLDALRLYERDEALGAFDAVLASAAIAAGAEALVSADAAFATVAGIPWVALDGDELERVIQP